MGQTPDLDENVKAWQRRLLQLSRRNNLLYFKPGRQAIPIVSQSPDSLLTSLGHGRRGLSFDYAEKRKPGSQSRDSMFEGSGFAGDSREEPGVVVTTGDLDTSLDTMELQRRLRGLQRKSREWSEEQGLNVLFLALGFLEWFDDTGEQASSPIVLVPCTLMRDGLREPFRLVRDDDDAVLNTTLQFVLEQRGVTIDDINGENVSELLEHVSEVVDSKDGWGVSEGIYVSTFAYSKLAMYQDLDGLRSQGITHPLVRQLAGEPAEEQGDSGSTPTALPPDTDLVGGRLDDYLDLKDQFTVLPADASQLRAVHLARSGDHLVVHGPPGTGKSQTIANVIATLLADGKRVLFVSEKTAALDVVKRRLEDCGLGIFCLDLHSERAKKSSVYEQLRESIEHPRTYRRSTAILEDLKRKRDSLNHTVRALHEVREPLGLSAFTVQGRYAQVEDSPDVPISVGDISTWTLSRLADVTAAVDQLVRRPDEFGEHATSPWVPLRDQPATLALVERLRATGSRLSASLGVFRTKADECAAELGIPRIESVNGAGALRALAEHLQAAPTVPRNWMTRTVVERLSVLAAKHEKHQALRRSLAATLLEHFRQLPTEVDLRSVAKLISTSETDRSSLHAALGVEWAKRVVPEPAAQLAKVIGARDSVRVFLAEYEALARISGLPLEPANWEEFDSNLELAATAASLLPVPPTWVENPAASAEEMRTAEHQVAQLAQHEAQFEATFYEDATRAIDRQLFDRFRTDYRSFWHRLGKSYRRDKRLLLAQLRIPRRIGVEESISLIEQVLTLVQLRQAWDEREASIRSVLGSRFRGRQTNWSSTRTDLQSFEAMRDKWPSEASTLLSVAVEAKKAEEFIRLVREAQAARSASVSALGELGGDALEQPEASSGFILQALHKARSPLERFEQACAPLRPLLARRPADVGELAALVETALRHEATVLDDRDAHNALSTDFAAYFHGPDTDWERIGACLGWTAEFLRLAGSPPTDVAAEHACAPRPQGEYRDLALRVDDAVSTLAPALESLSEDFDASRTRSGSWADAPLTDLSAWAAEVRDKAPSSHTWIEYRSACTRLDDLLSSGVVDAVRQATSDVGAIRGIILRRVYGRWLDEVLATDPELCFSPRDHEAIRTEFRELDQQFPLVCRERVRERCFAAYPDQYITGTRAGQLGTLRGELTKRRRQIPVRKLITRIPNILQALKPCFLMSPLAVSQYVPRTDVASDTVGFDAVVFDEASQVFPEDAVPAISRARQVIVMGDQKQLPPTSFFRRAAEDDEPEDEDYEASDALEGRESILDVLVGMSGRNVAETYLGVHYRSRAESLIRYSNHYFYDDKLLVFPGPDRTFTGRGIQDVYVPDGRYDAGGTRTNRVEAERVLDIILDLMRRTPERESIGVVTLSRAQADLVQRLVDEEAAKHVELADRFGEAGHERFFVKNLENVQGDERDHMILSIGYGPTTASGAVPNRFGPINANGGERRLNVAVTRARRTMTLVHSLRAEDITSTQPGAVLLRRYIEYARDPVGAFEKSVSLTAGSDTESPFEEAVLHALQARGHNMETQVGVAGYFIDLAIVSEDGTSFDLGIECDGAMYHSSPAARDRDWLRQDVLERLGWKIHRIWSTSWIRDPEARSRDA